MNAVASYCSSSADCTRNSAQPDSNTRDKKPPIRPYPDIINHNVDVGVGRSSISPEISSASSSSKQSQQPQYASVDKKSSKRSKSSPNEQLVGIVKHKDHRHAPSPVQYEQNQVHQQPPEITYQKIHPSTHQYPPRTGTNDTNPSNIKAAPKIDIIKTTYPDL